MKKKGRKFLSWAVLDPLSDTLPEPCYFLIIFTFILPAFFTSCSDHLSPQVPLLRGDVVTRISLPEDIPSVRCLDIFFFNDDRLRRLDSYQRIETPVPSSVEGASRDGKKILVLLANSSDDRYQWADINSYSSLSGIISELKNDDPAYPVMSAEIRLKAGYVHECALSLKPLMGKISISSLSCDFHGTAYEGSVLEDVKIYLTNVSSRSPVVNPDSSSATAFINLGRLQRNDFSDFARPEMLLIEPGSSIGPGILRIKEPLYCYPNAPAEEGPGTPRTRLVIEGTIDGRTYFYPIDAGREGSGVFGGEGYSYDITITRRGTDSPETPAISGSLRINSSVVPWDKIDNIKITY